MRSPNQPVESGSGPLESSYTGPPSQRPAEDAGLVDCGNLPSPFLQADLAAL